MEPSIIIAGIGALAGLGGALLVFVKGRGENRNQAYANKAAIDARIDARVTSELKRAYERVDEVETELRAYVSAAEVRERAMVRILSSLAFQWRGDPPRLNAADVKVLGDVIPPAWISTG